MSVLTKNLVFIILLFIFTACGGSSGGGGTTDTTAPVFTSSNTVSVNENQTSAIDLDATDDTSSVTYSISGGDSTDFDVNATTGVVTFKVAPDFETKTQYTFIATATDTSSNSATQNVTITILDVEPEPITHNGTTYDTVTSSYTGKIWLDRNLGASQVCTTFDDTACYGDYYQWGRNYDGHQLSTSAITTTLATDIDNAGTDFISTSSPYDWTALDNNGSLRAVNWSKTDASSVCPSGFRVPTITELAAETSSVTYNTDAFDNFLKLPSAGYRFRSSGGMDYQGVTAYLWSSTTSADADKSEYIGFSSTSYAYYGIHSTARAFGFSVRCISDAPSVLDTTAPTFTSSNTASVYENQTSVIDLNATDDTSNVTYSISGGESADFDVNATTGVVTFKVAPDFETQQNYAFTATAKDDANNSATQSISIIILDWTLEHNGVNYATVISPFTTKIWLDRNLGASQVCTALNDIACYGDYYQWGRNHDGHQLSTSGTNPTQAADIDNAGTEFITGTFDWTALDSDGSLRTVNWSATDGSSVCPIGYRVPTIAELTAETTSASTPVTDNITAFDNFLKLPSAGYRYFDDGSMDVQGTAGYVWSSSAFGSNSDSVNFNSIGANTNYYTRRTDGISVRCIED